MSELSQSSPQESPQAQSPESPAPVESQESPLQEAAPASPESPAASDAPEDEGQQPPAEKHKRPGGWQRKAEKLERQLEQALAALNVRPQPQPVQEQRQLTEQERAAEQLLTVVDQRAERILAQREADAERRRLGEALQQQMNEARARHEDFDEYVSSAPMPPQHVQAAILKSGAKAEIMYQLAKSPAELARISALPPLDAALEIGRLDVRFSSGAAQQSPPPRKPAPAPISPVTARGTSSVKPVDQMSYEEFKDWRKQSKR